MDGAVGELMARLARYCFTRRRTVVAGDLAAEEP